MLRVHGALLVSVLLSCGSVEPPRSALLVTLDTTRRDALSCYGGPAGLTPELDRLASEGVLYERAYTVAPITLPAHASMLTGLYPLRHGLHDNGVGALPAAAVTTAELAREHGIETAAFVAAVVLDSTFGLAQGFEVYDQVERGGPSASPHFERRDARAVVDAALAWLEARDRSRPFLAWLHFFDPHLPYPDRPGFRQQARGNPYHAQVAFLDRELGRFLRALDERGLARTTTVVVVADHGEALGDHGEATHGALCYDATLAVPLLVRRADGLRAGERARDVVGVADVHPTLLDALGLAVPDGLDGVSLLRAPLPDARGVYFESWYGYLNYGWSQITGWVDARHKLHHSAAPELYDVLADPGEARNLLGEQQAVAAAFRREIAALAARPALLADAAGAADEALLGELAALGYASGGTLQELPHPLDVGGRPAPHASLGELERIQEAFRVAQTEDAAAAARAWQEVRRLNPRNATALTELAFHLLRQGLHAEALAVYREVLPLAPPRSMVLMNTGWCLEQLGQRAEAIGFYRRAVERDPRNRQALQNLARSLSLEGREAEAREVQERLRADGSASR